MSERLSVNLSSSVDECGTFSSGARCDNLSIFALFSLFSWSIPGRLRLARSTGFILRVARPPVRAWYLFFSKRRIICAERLSPTPIGGYGREREGRETQEGKYPVCFSG